MRHGKGQRICLFVQLDILNGLDFPIFDDTAIDIRAGPFRRNRQRDLSGIMIFVFANVGNDVPSHSSGHASGEVRRRARLGYRDLRQVRASYGDSREAAIENSLVLVGCRIVSDSRQSLTECSDHISRIGNDLRSAIGSVGIAKVAPDAEHRAARTGDLRVAGEVRVIKAARLVGRTLPAGIAQHPIVITIGIDQLISIGAKCFRGSDIIAVPAAGPIANLISLARSNGHRIRVILIAETIVERARRHTMADDDVCCTVHELNKLRIQRRAHVFKTHGRQIIRVFICADVVVFAALRGKVLGVLVRNCKSKRHSLSISKIDRALRCLPTRGIAEI